MLFLIVMSWVLKVLDISSVESFQWIRATANLPLHDECPVEPLVGAAGLLTKHLHLLCLLCVFLAMSQITPGKQIPPLQFTLHLIILSFLGELAWARRFPDIFKRVLWVLCHAPMVFTPTGSVPLLAEY
jgi:hypothetical protein